MSPFYEILLFTSFILGLHLSGVLFITNRYNRLLNRLLGCVTFSVSMFYLVFYLIAKKWIIEVPFFARSFMPLVYLIPGCSYLYIRCFIRDEYKLRKKDVIHFLPFIANLILMLPYLFSPVSIKRELAKSLMISTDHYLSYNTGIVPEKYHLMIRLVLSVVYVLLIWKLMLGSYYRSFVRKSRKLYPHSIIWIWVFALFITFGSVFSGIMKWQAIFYNSTLTLQQGQPFSIILLLIYIGLLVYGLANPVILYGLPHFIKHNTPISSNDEKTGTDDTSPTPLIRYEPPSCEPVKVLFEKERMEEYEQMIRQYVADKMPYCDPEFNIASLSKGMNVPQHHLTYIFRFQIKQSFVDYRTQLRVEHVKRLLQRGMEKELTLEAIGEQAGFSSRTTFFLAFKKLTGQGPSQYLESLSINT